MMEAFIVNGSETHQSRVSQASGVGSQALPSLGGLKALVVEDEVLVSALVEDMLIDFGCILVGSAATVTEALAKIDAAPELDVAILDVNLYGEKSFAVADALIARGVPFMFATGYGPADIAQRYPHAPLLHKPYVARALGSTLLGLLPD